VRLGALQFSSWAIHMTFLIFFSNLLGIVMREWKGCNRRTVFAIQLALAVLLFAILVIGYGNYLGNKPV
jgi:L-rhamnose-H+ transport protein